MLTRRFAWSRISVLIILLSLAGMTGTGFINARQVFSSNLPPYALTGSYANYTGTGGNIAFLSGVSGNISYYVSNVLQNGSMVVRVVGNLSLGTEAGIPTSNVSFSLTDQIYSPKYFPAIPPSELGSPHIDFQNISCTYQTTARIIVPAGTFNGVEYQGTGANESVLDFWFDNLTGLALQMSGEAAELQLTNSNIALAIAPASAANVELQIIIVFLVGWTVAGLAFYWIRRHYLRKSRTDGYLLPEKKSDPKSKKIRKQD